MVKISKRMVKANEGVNKEELYTIADAVKTLKEASAVKFDETLEVALRLNVDPRQADQNLRGMISLPHGTGKTVKVAVFCDEDKVADAKAAGADKAGAEELIAEIKKGTVDFDVAIATPDMMPKMGQVARVLGPKGLMPNPKLGTVTPNFAEAVKKAKAGQVEYRVEKLGIVHAGVGKLSFGEEKLMENLKAFLDVVTKARPKSVKGAFVKGLSLSTTMGIGLKIDLAEVK